jgi:hypothetical protein
MLHLVLLLGPGAARSSFWWKISKSLGALLAAASFGDVEQGCCLVGPRPKLF